VSGYRQHHYSHRVDDFSAWWNLLGKWCIAAEALRQWLKSDRLPSAGLTGVFAGSLRTGQRAANVMNLT